MIFSYAGCGVEYATSDSSTFPAPPPDVFTHPLNAVAVSASVATAARAVLLRDMLNPTISTVLVGKSEQRAAGRSNDHPPDGMAAPDMMLLHRLREVRM